MIIHKWRQCNKIIQTTYTPSIPLNQVCSRLKKGIDRWARSLSAPRALGPRLSAWFGNGSSPGSTQPRLRHPPGQVRRVKSTGHQAIMAAALRPSDFLSCLFPTLFALLKRLSCTSSLASLRPLRTLPQRGRPLQQRQRFRQTAKSRPQPLCATPRSCCRSAPRRAKASAPRPRPRGRAPPPPCRTAPSPCAGSSTS